LASKVNNTSSSIERNENFGLKLSHFLSEGFAPLSKTIGHEHNRYIEIVYLLKVAFDRLNRVENAQGQE